MQWWVDFIAGSVSGFFGLAVSYPLDIIKCRMQLEFKEYRNIKSAFFKILHEEKFTGLYKGFTAPCINVIPLNAL
jgi:solute carrier family 25 carnitine/acylcarnitine transporter 20/29